MNTLKDRLERIIAEAPRGSDHDRTVQEASDALIELLRAEWRAMEVLREYPGSKIVEPRDSSLAGLTLHEAARRALEEVGRPLHVRELGELIKARGWRHPRSQHARPDQILFQLAARLPRHPEFERVAPNTFALRVWRSESRANTRPPTRLGLFRGPGGATARSISETEEPFASEDVAWRSS